MNTHKKHPKKQMEKYSKIFSQIGLVLVLFISYTIIEQETLVKKMQVRFLEPDDEIVDFTFIAYEKEKPKPKKKNPVTSLDKIEKKKDDEPKEEDVVKPTEPDPEEPIDDNEGTEEVKKVEEPKVDPIYDARMFTPIFKGCKSVGLEENRACFEKKMRKFVQRRFDTEQGLNPGRYRVYAQFVINKEGDVTDIKVKAPSKKLEREMRRVILKLPKFTPGMHGDKPVSVKYVLPLVFEVD